MYIQKASDRSTQPCHVFAMEDTDSICEAGNPVCDHMMAFHIKGK